MRFRDRQGYIEESMMGVVTVEDRGPVTIISINRP
jgi:hypothetical protein